MSETRQKNKKKDVKFKSLDSLQSVVKVINEASEALNDKTRTVQKSSIPDFLGAALGVK